MSYNPYPGGGAGNPQQPQRHNPPVYGSNPTYGSGPSYGSTPGYGTMPGFAAAAGFPPGPNEPNPNPQLNEPWYGIGFWEATKRMYKKTLRFSGFASRSEYWWASLSLAIMSFALYIVYMVVATVIMIVSSLFLAGASNTGDEGLIIGGFATSIISMILYMVFGLVMIVAAFPTISLTIRRLHDAGYSGWFYLLVFVPFGSIAVLIFTIMETNKAKWQPGWVDRTP